MVAVEYICSKLILMSSVHNSHTLRFKQRLLTINCALFGEEDQQTFFSNIDRDEFSALSLALITFDRPEKNSTCGHCEDVWALVTANSYTNGLYHKTPHRDQLGGIENGDVRSG